ncbi:MAG: bifunctional tetrahydrofolate synthase/dihydrofolate synthase [Candidatus Pelagadaptatus aseana]|uniref:bifunctional tetrahydrofolate synthase/dihydrofolate synthase n=1 Tax=Candidatus Pelagadaptatus aseana TaxID=3120508 RepID=UPI0039B2EA76
MRYKTLNEWLSWQESLHSKEIDMGLDRIRQVAERLDLLRPESTVITVAGTNGKGSCVATLEAMCLADGKTVGAFTSPHLNDYNERIRVNGEMASDEDICLAFERIDQARGDISLTYFEFGALAALEVFARHRVEVALLEVGLGGRLDAVNIIDADVAIVTSIAIDHEAWLGSDREVIGREKAGIFRQGKPAICADKNAPQSVAAYAGECGAQLYRVGEAFDWGITAGQWFWRSSDLQLDGLPVPGLPQPSVAAALKAYQLLWSDLPESLVDILGSLTLAGRGQKYAVGGVDVVLDVAHNPAAAELLAETLMDQPVQGQTHGLVAVMADKDLTGVFSPLLACIDQWHVSALPGNDRAADVETMAQALQRPCQQYQSIPQAVEAILPSLDAGDRLVIFGSFFTVADAQKLLNDVEF